MTTANTSSDELIITAPSGVRWRRLPGKTCTPLLGAVFASEPAIPRKKPDKQGMREALEQQLRSAESKAERSRRGLSELGPGDG